MGTRSKGKKGISQKGKFAGLKLKDRVKGAFGSVNNTKRKNK